MTRIYFGSATDLGKREVNEDSLLSVVAQDSSSGASGSQSSGATALLILADGMGGRSRGQLASRTAIKVMFKELAHILALRADCDRNYLESNLQHAFRAANTRIRELCKDQPDSEAMGTTATAAVITRGMAVIAHVGDTRCYLHNPEDGLSVLTEDHSVVRDEVRSGRLSEDEARKSKFRNVITRALGVEETLTPDLITHEMRSGDTLILCSDGLHGSVTDGEIDKIVNSEDDPQVAADKLVESAVGAGAKDNISVIVARLEGTDVFTDPNSNDPADSAGGRGGKSKVFGNVVSFLFGIILVGAILWLMVPTYVSRSLKVEPPDQVKVLPAAAPAPPPIILSSANYAAPEPLLGRQIGGTVLLRAGEDMIVDDPQIHRVLRVLPNGQVSTSTPDAADLAATPARSIYWATDVDGNMYASQTVPPMIRKYGSDGGFLRTIGQGTVKAPAAITVLSNGDVYVIDSNTLTRYKAVPPSAVPIKPPQPVPVKKSL